MIVSLSLCMIIGLLHNNLLMTEKKTPLLYDSIATLYKQS